MRSWRGWTMQVVLLLGLGAVAAQAADKEDRGRSPKSAKESPSSSWSWMNPTTWFGTTEKEKTANAKGKKDNKKADLPPLPSPVDEARARRTREEATLLRRLQVCTELRAIAQRREDQAMLQRVDEMEHRAFQVYSQRLGMQAPVPGAGGEADLSILDNRRDAEALLRRRPGEEPIYNVTSDRANRGDGVKEVDR